MFKNNNANALFANFLPHTLVVAAVAMVAVAPVPATETVGAALVADDARPAALMLLPLCFHVQE